MCEGEVEVPMWGRKQRCSDTEPQAITACSFGSPVCVCLAQHISNLQVPFLLYCAVRLCLQSSLSSSRPSTASVNCVPVLQSLCWQETCVLKKACVTFSSLHIPYLEA